MKKIIIITIFATLVAGIVLLSQCKRWEWGETITYTIPEGKHAEFNFPTLIKGTEVWGGEMIIEYNPDQMIDTTHGFSYWNKLGGMMPDLSSNLIPGEHQSARAAWRIDPPDMDHVYLGYIVYVWGQETPERDYLYTPEGEKVRVGIGEPFKIFVSKSKTWWGITYGNEEAWKKIEDEELRGEQFMVAMDPYYGGHPVAPTEITITLRVYDTTWIYN